MARAPQTARSAVTVIGGIGHCALDAELDVPYVHLSFHRILAELVRRFPRLRAVSALASGADTVFAECARGLSIPLESVIPFADFAADFPAAEAEARLDALRSKVAAESRVNFSQRGDRAYKKSMEWVVMKSNIVLAAWDGRQAGAPGGTWGAVALCEALGKPLIHVDTSRKAIAVVGGPKGGRQTVVPGELGRFL